MADSKKTEFFKIANSQITFENISEIGAWVKGQLLSKCLLL